MALTAISRATVDDTKRWIWSKNGLAYDYGGDGEGPGGDGPGGDCSWFACAGAARLLGLSTARRYGSTESFNCPGRYGAVASPPAAVLGIVHARSKADVPADAVLKHGYLHGGGGENSHVSSTLDGLNFESRGMYRGVSGHVVAGTARAWNDSLFHDFWYLPRTVGPVDPNAFPLPDGYVYGWATGPDWQISCRFDESSEWKAGLKRYQAAVDVPVSGVYDQATHEATRRLQAATPGLLPDGFVGPLTWRAAISAPTGSTAMQACAAANGWLGAPSGAAAPCKDGVGRYRVYAAGCVYWHPRTGASAIPRGGLLEAYEARRWEQGPLGYPVRPFARLPRGGVQAFTGGTLYVLAGGDPRGAVVSGAIRDRWAADGWEAGRHGWPLADAEPLDGGQIQRFEHAVLASHPRGAVDVAAVSTR